MVFSCNSKEVVTSNFDSDGWKMADIVVLEPVLETMELHAEADSKSKLLLARLLEAAASLMKAQGRLDEACETLLALKAEYLVWKNRTDQLAEVLEAVHDRRSDLWSIMPQGQETAIIAEFANGSCTVVMRAERRFARVICRDFAFLERLPSGELGLVEFQRHAA